MTGPTLFDVWPCPNCGGTGERVDPETGQTKPCRTCQGTGQAQDDPNDDTAIPY